MPGKFRQIDNLEEALKLVRNWQMAIDVGAYVGKWSQRMAEKFERVAAFEPEPKLVKHWQDRLSSCLNAKIFEVALADRPGQAEIVMSRGTTIVSKGSIRYSPAGSVQVRTLDSFKFRDVGLLKVDVEGADALVLLGASKTIRRSRPVVVVENIVDFQQDFGDRRVPEVMMGYGAKLVFDRFPDQIWTFD